MKAMDLRVLGRWLAVAVMTASMLVACGRTAMHSPCDDDDDCPADQMCVAGSCTPEGSTTLPDAGHDTDVPPDTDVEDPRCTSDLDCGEGLCRDGEQEGECITEVCDTATGLCEVTSCTPDCSEDEQESGCHCIPNECESNDECFGQICHNGTCRPCVSDAECSDDGTMVCKSDGFCGPGPDCVDDDDCAPHQECGPDQTCVERPECVFNDDCEEDEQCIAGTCTYTPECEDDGDCSDQAECVGGHCQTKMCRGNDDCPDDELCDAGECVPPPVALSCEIVTSSQTLVPNQRITLQAFAYDAQGNGVAASFSWSSSNPQVAEIDGNELVGNPVPGTTTVTAVLQGGDPVACDGAPEFENLGLSAANDIRVRVHHMETGQAVEGAEVHIGDESADTDGAGLVELPKPMGEQGPAETYDVHVFHDDFNYLTVKDVAATDIRLPISPQSGTGPVAGYTGEFDVSAIHTSGDIELGLAGASLAGDLLDLNLERLFGDPFVTEFDVMGMGGDVPLPGGVTAHGEVFGFEVEGKQNYYVQAAEGPRLAWGIAGEIPFDDILGVITDPPEDIGSAIGQFLPLFSRFDHAQQSQVFEALPRVLDVEDINNNGDTSEWLPDYNNFPEIDLLPSVRQQLTTDVHISSLPTLGGEQAEVAVLLGSTLTDGVGLVPLGISATMDEEGTGQPEERTLYMAPPYGSAVGGRYAVTAIAFATGGEEEEEETDALPSDFSVALWNGQSLGTETALGTFPDSSTGSVDEEDRLVSVDDAKAGPIFRVRLIDAQRSWDVWSKGDGEAGQFSDDITIPDVPGGWSDLFDSDAEIHVDAIRSSVSIDDLVRSSGVGLERAGLVTTSFNRTTFR